MSNYFIFDTYYNITAPELQPEEGFEDIEDAIRFCFAELPTDDFVYMIGKEEEGKPPEVMVFQGGTYDR